MNRILRNFLSGALCTTIGFASAYAEEDRLRLEGMSADLQGVVESVEGTDEVPVIITFKRRLDPGRFGNLDKDLKRQKMIGSLREISRESDTVWREYLTERGGRDLKKLWIRNAMAAVVPAETISQLAAMPTIQSVSLDHAVKSPKANYTALSKPDWNIELIGADQLWEQNITGHGVVIANMDTGVDHRHLDLESQWRGGDNSWFDPHGEHDSPYDVDGHGTQTMGVMVGGDSTGTNVGIAPDAKWIAVKIFSDEGTAKLSDIVMGFQWLLDPDGNPVTNDSPHVVNNSWVFSNTVGDCDLGLQDDIELLREAGIAVVFSAGNYGPAPSSDASPANNAGSLAVGAVDSDPNSTLSRITGRGPSSCAGAMDVYPQLVAPGEDIKTTDLTFGFIEDNSISVSGTSFAAPHVAGAIALLKSALPAKSIRQIEKALKDSATDLGSTGPEDGYGHGMINVAAAYSLLTTGSTGAVDVDNDRFTAEFDCNDNDATIYPDAEEVIRDGIDQDCNGHDLTIEIVKVVVDDDADAITVDATSDLADPEQIGGLKVRLEFEDGTNSRAWNMTYFADQKFWGGVIDEYSTLSKYPVSSLIVNGYEGKSVYSFAINIDEDLDGYSVETDCDDNDVSIFPGADEIPNDGIDQDCDGSDLIEEVKKDKRRFTHPIATTQRKKVQN